MADPAVNAVELGREIIVVDGDIPNDAGPIENQRDVRHRRDERRHGVGIEVREVLLRGLERLHEVTASLPPGPASSDIRQGVSLPSVRLPHATSWLAGGEV